MVFCNLKRKEDLQEVTPEKDKEAEIFVKHNVATLVTKTAVKESKKMVKINNQGRIKRMNKMMMIAISDP